MSRHARPDLAPSDDNPTSVIDALARAQALHLVRISLPLVDPRRGWLSWLAKSLVDESTEDAR